MPTADETNIDWNEVLKKEARGRSINLAIELANNHYAGFGPETTNIFRKMIGLTSVDWQEAKRKYDKLVPTEQKSLSDYL